MQSATIGHTICEPYDHLKGFRSDGNGADLLECIKSITLNRLNWLDIDLKENDLI
mgnify:CR=1 FL=1